MKNFLSESRLNKKYRIYNFTSVIDVNIKCQEEICISDEIIRYVGVTESNYSKNSIKSNKFHTWYNTTFVLLE